MSIEIRSRVVCDGGCGLFIDGKVGLSTSSAWESHSHAQLTADRAGWLRLTHGRYYKPTHYCPACQDKPLPKLKANKKRPPQNPPCKIVGLE